MDHSTDTAMAITRDQLGKWGSWWRSRWDHVGYPRVNQIHAMMEVAKLGVRVQHSPRHNHSEEIMVPYWVLRIDHAVSRLSLRERALLVYLYQRVPGWNRKTLKRKSPVLDRALLRAEVKVARSLGAYGQTLSVWTQDAEEPTLRFGGDLAQGDSLGAASGNQHSS
jgi:hypothetical protein